MRMLLMAIGGAVVSGFSTGAAADVAAGNACAAHLSPLALEIYRATAPALRTDTVIRELLSAKVRPMVMSGQVAPGPAREAARAAGHCLSALRS